jgi:GNAT superfamily N-acetyltransferase
MRVDFELNSLIVAKENGKVSGFLCYTSYSGKILLMWLGVKKEFQRKGVGQKLLTWLEDEGKRFGFHSIEVETLPDEEDYEPYQRTRTFYYKNGFKRILYKKARVKGWDDQIVLEKKL